MVEVEKRIVEAVELLKNFLQQLLTSKDSHQNKVAGLLAYWIKDYVRLMSKERSCLASFKRKLVERMTYYLLKKLNG